MSRTLDLFSDEHAAVWTENQLLMIRATLAGIPLSLTSAPDASHEAAWALEGLCVGLERIVEGIAGRTPDKLVRNLCVAARAGGVQVRRELVRRATDPHGALVRARLTLLRSIALLAEIQDIAAYGRDARRPAIDPVEVARAVVLIAVRANGNDHAWIIAVAEAELSLLANVPREWMDDEFRRKLGALRTLLGECANYETQRTVGVARELQDARRAAGAALD